VGVDLAARLWSSLADRVGGEFGEPLLLGEMLGRPRAARLVRAAATAGRGRLVLKLRRGDRAGEKVAWRAENLPLLAGRGYPVPAILWHGALEGGWYAAVEERLPGEPLRALDGSRLQELLALVELQADARIEPGPRAFGAYISSVLFEGWDGVWATAARASPEAAAMCERLRIWLQPLWGYRIDCTDFAHHDLNPTNILTDGRRITGIVDWDEFGLGTRAADVVGLAFACVRLQRDRLPVPPGSVQAALDHARQVAGEAGLRCLVAYRVLGHLASLVERGELDQVPTALAEGERMLAFVSAA
jgi:Phosphotransferase enzyme family